MRIDHVIWTTADLSAAEVHLKQRYGLSASGGGRHEGHGTHNRIIPLGGGFIELLAVEDPEMARVSPIGRAVAKAPDGLFGWVVAVDDVAAHIERLGISKLVLRRGDLRMPLGGVVEAMSSPWLPFFLERPAGSADPGGAGADGGIASIEVGCDPQELSAWLGGATLPLRCTPTGPPGLRSVTLGSGKVISGAG
jgi:hypothetical protein